MEDHLKNQSDYDDKMKELMVRKFEIMGYSEDDVNQMINQHDPEGHLFTQEYLRETDEMRGKLNEVNERHEAMKALEKSIVEVSELFTDMAHIIETQGEVVDSIEANMDRTVVHVEKGREQLATAKTLQTSVRKKKLCCYGILVILLIGVVVAIVLSVK